MLNPEKKQGYGGIFSSVLVAYSILILHIVLIFLLAIAVFFLGGLINNFIWIFFGIIVLLIASGYYFFRWFKLKRKNIGDAINSPVFNGRSVQVSLLGGLASLKIEAPNNLKLLTDNAKPPKEISDFSNTEGIHEIEKMAKLYDDGLITYEEYRILKDQFFSVGK